MCTDLQCTITDRFCERRVNTRFEFTKLFRSEGLGWDMIPLEIKNINSLQKFKIEIKKWPPENYSCFLCRPYMQNLGFIDLI